MSRDRDLRGQLASASRVAAAVSVVLAVLAAVPRVDAGAVQSGAASIVTPTTDGPTVSGQQLSTGDSSTEFSLELPPGAACAGDSAGQDYRIYGYMVAEAIDPGSLELQGDNGPRPEQYGAPQESFRQPLFETSTSGYNAVQTANADEPGGPGFVVNIPAFTFRVFQPGDVPSGGYNIGIACVGPGTTQDLDRYWNVVVDVAVDGADTGPTGITWTARNSGASAAPDPSPGDGAEDGGPVVTAGGDASGTEDDSGPDLSVATERSDDDTRAVSQTGTVPGDDGVEEVDAHATGPMMALPVLSVAHAAGSLSVLVWAALAVVFGRMARLLSRSPSVLPAVA